MTAQLAGNGILSILRTACLSPGLEASGAELIPSGSHNAYRLPGGLVIRIDRLGELSAAQREVETARWLAASGMAAPQVVTGIPQPIEVGGHPITYWRELPPHGPATPADRAIALRDLHDLTPPPSMGRLDPLAGITEELGSTPILTAEDRVWILDHLAELRGRWAAVFPMDRKHALLNSQPWCAVHGQAWRTSVGATADGPLLLDVAHVAIGPPDWDLVPAAIECFSLGWLTGGEYRGFCDEYRTDVVRRPGFYLLRDIREFRMTTRAIRAAATDPALTPQARHRLACLRGDVGPRRWPGWEPI